MSILVSNLYKNIRWRVAIIGIVLFSVSHVLHAGEVSVLDNLPEKHALDRSEYRRFVLENGMKVLLLSDPDLNKSSASMAVEIGSLGDPEDAQGLAHFLEHMLFLGTEKYPEVDEYGSYLKSNGGYSNAYTSRMVTNYHFEVYPNALEGALDRFAQFFVAPLFSKEYTEREMNAVESEFQKNLQNDGWRALQVKRSLYNPEHPENHFSIGNLGTLSHIQREVLLKFYNQYYSSDRMSLAVTSSKSLDELEKWVRQYFSEVKKIDVAPLEVSPDYLLQEETARISFIEPIADVRNMMLEFALPSIHSFYESKPMDLIAFCIGDEGEGSLLSLLKKEGLATALGSFSHDETGVYGRLMVDISLTPKGLEEYERVLEYFFSYVHMLKQTGYQSRLFEEQAIQARLNEVYNDKGEGADRAVFLANQLTQFPIEIAEREPYLYTQEDPEAYEEFLSYLKPENMIVMISAKGVETEYTEPYFGTQYSVKRDGDLFSKLKSAPSVKELYFPPANAFIPKKVQLIPENVVKIINEKGVSLYYSQDKEFQRPKVTMMFNILPPNGMQSTKIEILKSFYSACVKEALNEIAYPASVAGLHYLFDSDTHKTHFTISGYSESASSLLDHILKTMVDFNLPEDQFIGVKDAIIRGLENFDVQDAWKITRFYKNQFMEEYAYAPSEMLEYAKGISQEDVKKFSRDLLKQGVIEALVHGNCSAEDAKSYVMRIQDKLKLVPIDRSDACEPRFLVHKKNESILRLEQLKVNNSCFWREYELGLDDAKSRAASLMFNNFIQQPFYTEMRTKRQLGYIVWGGSGRKERRLFSYFVIQSATHAADELMANVDPFIAAIPQMFESLSDESFEKIRSAAISQMEEKPKSIAEKATHFFQTVYYLDGDFNRKKDTILELKHMTRSDMAKLINQWFSAETSVTRTTLSFSEKSKIPETLEPSFSDPNEWKKNRIFDRK